MTLTWKVEVSKTLTYALGNSPPEWASLDVANSKLVLDIPVLTETLEYTFSIDTFVTGDSNTFTKPIYLKVSHWEVPNWSVWQSGSSDRWNTWNEGYDVYSSYQSWEQSETEKYIK